MDANNNDTENGKVTVEPKADDWTPITPEKADTAMDTAILRVLAQHANHRKWGIPELAERAGIDPDLTQRLFEANAKLTTNDVDRIAIAFGGNLFAIMEEAAEEKRRIEPQGLGLTPSQIKRLMRAKYLGVGDDHTYRMEVVRLLTAIVASLDPDGRLDTLDTER